MRRWFWRWGGGYPYFRVNHTYLSVLKDSLPRLAGPSCSVTRRKENRKRAQEQKHCIIKMARIQVAVAHIFNPSCLEAE